MPKQGRLTPWLLVVVSVLVAFAVGCNPGTATQIDSAATPVVPADGPVLPTFDWDGPEYAQFLNGEIAVEGRCLYLGSDPQTRRLAVFAAGSAFWEGDTLLLGDRRFEIGERISAGGRELPDLSNVEFLQEPHDSCDVRRVVLIFGAGRA